MSILLIMLVTVLGFLAVLVLAPIIIAMIPILFVATAFYAVKKIYNF